LNLWIKIHKNEHKLKLVQISAYGLITIDKILLEKKFDIARVASPQGVTRRKRVKISQNSASSDEIQATTQSEIQSNSRFGHFIERGEFFQ
jgi:hypothetical protein